MLSGDKLPAEEIGRMKDPKMKRKVGMKILIDLS
jgi:hypothetical protein